MKSSEIDKENKEITWLRTHTASMNKALVLRNRHTPLYETYEEPYEEDIKAVSTMPLSTPRMEETYQLGKSRQQAPHLLHTRRMGRTYGSHVLCIIYFSDL